MRIELRYGALAGSEITMKTFILFLFIAMTPVLHATAAEQTPEQIQQTQNKIRQGSSDILDRLYGIAPSSRKQIAAAYGYAVFSTFGMKLMVAGGGNGKGMAVSHKPKREVFMKMVSVQAGLGFGIKQTQLVFVFKTKQAFDQFVNSGWEVGGQVSVAATDGSSGLALDGAVAVAPGVWLYQMTEKGLAAELAVKGTKFYQDASLN